MGNCAGKDFDECWLNDIGRLVDECEQDLFCVQAELYTVDLVRLYSNHMPNYDESYSAYALDRCLSCVNDLMVGIRIDFGRICSDAYVMKRHEKIVGSAAVADG